MDELNERENNIDTLKRGSMLYINGRSDFITFRFQNTITKEIIEINYHDDRYDEIIKRKDTKELLGISNFLPFEAELVEDIPYLEDYTDTDFRLVYKVRDKVFESEVIEEFHVYNKLELNKRVIEDISEYVEELRKKIDVEETFSQVKADEKTGNIRTRDGLVYFFDFIKIVS